MYFWLSLVSAENNICKPEQEINFSCVNWKKQQLHFILLFTEIAGGVRANAFTEINLLFTFIDVIFGRDKRQAENQQKKVVVVNQLKL